MLNVKAHLTKLTNGLDRYVAFSTETMTISVNANTYGQSYVSITKSGYTPIGIIGFDPAGGGTGSLMSVKFYIRNVTEGSGEIFYGYRNNGNNNITNATITFTVLWRKEV